MKIPCCPLTAALFLLGTTVGANALAADAPKRKSGLWEIKTRMEGMPSPGPMQLCVDQINDNLLQQEGKAPPNCSVMDIDRSGGKMAIHSVCKHEDLTVTTDALITGDLDSGYKNDMRVRYSPPQFGMSETRMAQEAQWLGPCKPGQKPGDVMMSGIPGGKVNLQEMMNSPQVREFLKQQRLQ